MKIHKRLHGLILLVMLGQLQMVDAVAALSCSVTTGGIQFGDYLTFNISPVTVNESIQVTCTVLPPETSEIANITITLSSGGAGGFNPRSMQSSTDHLSYNLYTTANYTNIWGDGTGGTQVVSDSFVVNDTGAEQRSYTMHGMIPAQQDVDVGAYSDTLIVTLTF